MMEKNERDYQIEETKMILEAYSKSIEKFDKQSLLIATGSLVVSTSYLNSLIPIKSAVCFPLYITAVIVMLLSIIFGLIGHYISAVSIGKLLDDDSEEEKEEKIDHTLWINFLVLFLTILGLVLIAVFSIFNLIS